MPAHVKVLVRPAGAQRYLQQNNRSGVVDVKVYLSKSGGVTSAVIVRSSGDPFLDGATYNAATATTYAAEIRACASVEGAYIYRVKYNSSPTPSEPPPSPAPSSVPTSADATRPRGIV